MSPLHQQEQLPKRERTRAQLLDAALSVLMVRGLEATSIDDLMAVAGMARSTFYNYFQSRDDVLVAVSQHIEALVLEQVISHVPAAVPDDTRVACTIYGLLGFFLANPRLGWVQIRLTCGLRWLENQSVRNARFRDFDRSLAAITGDKAPFLATTVYLEGSILTLLRRLLEQHVTVAEAEATISMTLRGLGIAEKRLPDVMKEARAFAASMPSTRSGTLPDHAAAVLKGQSKG